MKYNKGDKVIIDLNLGLKTLTGTIIKRKININNYPKDNEVYYVNVDGVKLIQKFHIRCLSIDVPANREARLNKILKNG